LILVGDNPFQGVSHLSRESSLRRPASIADAAFATEIVKTAIAHGASGFTFTVSGITLAILGNISRDTTGDILYYPLVPDVTRMVRTAGNSGGIPGIARDMAWKVVVNMDRRLPFRLMKGALLNRPASLLESYINYEYLRLKQAIGRRTRDSLKTILLHEVVTDMALALDMAWVFRAHIGITTGLGLKPGFETRNLPYLAKQLRRWHIDSGGVVIEAPFNAVGFQMCPSKADCEAALEHMSGAEVIAFSALAAGYLQPPEAFDYIANLNGLGGVAVGVSSIEQAGATFSLARQVLSKSVTIPGGD
jgi:hypothetical protein